MSCWFCFVFYATQKRTKTWTQKEKWFVWWILRQLKFIKSHINHNASASWNTMGSDFQVWLFHHGGTEMQLVGNILHNFAHQISRVAYNLFRMLFRLWKKKTVIMIEYGVSAARCTMQQQYNRGTTTCFICAYPWSMWTVNLAHIVNCIEFRSRRTPLERWMHVRLLLLNAECRCSSKMPLFFCPSCSVYCVHARIQEQTQNMIAALIISILHLFVVACCPWAFARI